MLKTNCELVRKDHDFSLINVEKLNPYLIEAMITNIPHDSLYSIKWYLLSYECTRCNVTNAVYQSLDELDEEALDLLSQLLHDRRSYYLSHK
jgi:hypothetical protein